jgi:hypothetical protein
MHMSDTKLVMRPTLLVSLSTEVTGGVHYQRRDLDERCAKDGKNAMGSPATCKRLKGHEGKCDFSEMTTEEITKWETTKIVADKAEHERATKARNKARSLVTALTVWSNFGQLCPTEREAELNAAYAQARAVVDEFNAGSMHTTVGVYMMTAEIPDNTQNIQSLSSDLVKMIDQMMGGVNSGDEEMIREAANKLTALTEVLGDEAKSVAARAIEDARSAARAIVKAKAEKATAIEKQKETNKKAAAAKVLQQARKALDMNAEIMAKIEAAAKAG